MTKMIIDFSTSCNYLFMLKNHGGIKEFFINTLKMTKQRLIYDFIKNYFKKNIAYHLNRADIKIKEKDSKKILLIRDPRDICISAAKYDGMDDNNDPKDSDFFKYKKAVDQLSFEGIIIHQATHNSLDTVRRLIKFIEEENPLVIKYEDLFMDYGRYEYVNKIADYLELNMIEKSNFKTSYVVTHLNNSRHTNHTNSGQPKQYLDLDKDTLQRLNSILEQYIVKLGYTI